MSVLIVPAPAIVSATGQVSAQLEQARLAVSAGDFALSEKAVFAIVAGRAGRHAMHRCQDGRAARADRTGLGRGRLREVRSRLEIAG